jgi:G6PDH family F420-dependent oxidoreductase
MTEPRFGLTLSSEEHSPASLVDQAVAAEAAGFDFVGISDHFHPWIEEQGHSPFVWSVLGAISQATQTLEVGVGVSCPILRIHPVIYAQATATTACLLEGRFTWGVGTGEALNEHVTGRRWPTADLRLEMLGEAIDLIRELWSGESVTHRGKHYTVEDARIFDLPQTLPPLIVSAFGPKAAELAAEKGDGLWITGVNHEVLEVYRRRGGQGRIWTQMSLCWDLDQDRAVERARRLWPNTALPGQLSQELRTVSEFEEAIELVGPETIEREVPCGPDPEPIIEAIRQAVDAGIDQVYLHQIGDPLDGFLDFWQEEVLPKL